MSESRAQLIRENSERAGVAMSMHGAYYISLASKNPETREKSKQRLVNGLHWAPKMGVKRIVFHPGGYGGLSKHEAYEVVRAALREVWAHNEDLLGKVWLAPEIAGKLSMFGSQDEIISICRDVDGCIPTIDWAHLHARTQGRINDRDSFIEVLNRFEDALGNLFTKNMHFHISGITYTEAGEQSHRPLGSEWGPDLLPLLQIVKENGYKPTFISETPEPVKGALYAKILLEELESTEE